MTLTPSLTDAQVAVLARQAVDLLSTDIAIRIVPGDEGSIYRSVGTRWWSVRLPVPGSRGFAIRVDGSMSPAEALAHLLAELSVYSSGTDRFRDTPFPHCLARHAHAARPDPDPSGVALRCPDTGAVVDLVSPAA